jgi:hypothetical protein
MMISFRQKSGLEVVLQNACHGSHIIFPVFPLKIALFTTPITQFVSILPIIFVMLLKNAHTIVLQDGATCRQAKSFAGDAYMRPLPLPCATISVLRSRHEEVKTILPNAGDVFTAGLLGDQ